MNAIEIKRMLMEIMGDSVRNGRPCKVEDSIIHVRKSIMKRQNGFLSITLKMEFLILQKRKNLAIKECTHNESEAIKIKTQINPMCYRVILYYTIV